MDYILGLIILVLYLIPLYIANATPILIHGKTPLDFNKKLFGKPIFGKGKTIIGAASGIIAGAAAGAVISIFIPSVLEVLPNYIFLAFILGLGAILGDLVKSFFKRRYGIKSGEKWAVADQLDFVAGGIVLSALLTRMPEWWVIIALLVATFFIHSATNFVAFRLKLKKVPW